MQSIGNQLWTIKSALFTMKFASMLWNCYFMKKKFIQINDFVPNHWNYYLPYHIRMDIFRINDTFAQLSNFFYTHKDWTYMNCTLSQKPIYKFKFRAGWGIDNMLKNIYINILCRFYGTDEFIFVRIRVH